MCRYGSACNARVMLASLFLFVHCLGFQFDLFAEHIPPHYYFFVLLEYIQCGSGGGGLRKGTNWMGAKIEMVALHWREGGGREKTNAIHCIVSKSNTRKMPESNGRWVYPNQTACHIHAMIASNECVQRV